MDLVCMGRTVIVHEGLVIEADGVDHEFVPS